MYDYPRIHSGRGSPGKVSTKSWDTLTTYDYPRTWKSIHGILGYFDDIWLSQDTQKGPLGKVSVESWDTLTTYNYPRMHSGRVSPRLSIHEILRYSDDIGLSQDTYKVAGHLLEKYLWNPGILWQHRIIPGYIHSITRNLVILWMLY